MTHFLYEVVVDTDTIEHAEIVMRERLGPEEEYEDDDGLPIEYKLDWQSYRAREIRETLASIERLLRG